MKILIVLLTLLSIACTRTEYIRVPKPVDRPVYCANNVEKKQYATSSLIAKDSPEKKVKQLLIERNQRRIVERELRAELEGCARPRDSGEDSGEEIGR